LEQKPDRERGCHIHGWGVGGEERGAKIHHGTKIIIATKLSEKSCTREEENPNENGENGGDGHDAHVKGRRPRACGTASQPGRVFCLQNGLEKT